jgi:hypothetical protein
VTGAAAMLKIRKGYYTMSTRQDSSIKTARGCLRDTAWFAPLVFIALAYMTPQAAPNPMINYFKPIPIVGKLTTSGWGYTSVGPRDSCNGIEDIAKYRYWDGKIMKAPNGKYHLFCSRWPTSAGMAGWLGQSISVHAVSDSILGPYKEIGPTYTYQNSKGHNTTGLMLKDSTYAIIESAIVPGWIFTSKTLDGPFTYKGSISWNDNWFNIGQPTSNLTIFIGPDNKYWGFSNTGAVMNNADSILGTYQVRTSMIYLPNPGEDMGKAEDPIMWYSGGYYHVVYNYWNTRRAYHIMSKDGIHNWINTGLAVDRSSNFCRYTNGTVNHWGNMERPNVYMENGHVTYFTFAVTDLNKDSSDASTGTKVIVVPFDGMKFDADSGGTVVTGIAGRSGGIAGKNMVAHNVKSTLIDLSGRAVGKNNMPRSGIYMVQTADGRWIKKTFNFGNERGGLQ